MVDTSSPVVLVRQARNMLYGVPARHIRTFDDGTALVRFAAGNFRIVPLELLQRATKAQAEEFDGASAAAGELPLRPIAPSTRKLGVTVQAGRRGNSVAARR